jgi:hypothetical protein
MLMSTIAACSNDGPRLLSANPGAARVGNTIDIAGERLCGAANDCARTSGTMTFGLEFPAKVAPVRQLAPTEMMVEVPLGMTPGKTEIVALINGESSNALLFEVLP